MPPYANKQYEAEQKIVQGINGGLNQSKPASNIQDSEATDLLNVQFRRGKLRVDTGYTQFHPPAKIGMPMGQFQFITTVGELFTFLVTTGSLFKDNGTQWEYVPDGSRQTNLLASTGAGANTFSVPTPLNAAWAAGQKIGIRLSDGSQLQSTITQISGGSIQTADAVPAGLTAPGGGDVVGPVALNGTTTIQPTGITWAVTDWFIFTNGVDPPWAFKQAQNAVVPLGGTPPVCHTLGVFHGFLILGNTSDGSGSHPQRLQNSDLDNAEEWTAGLSSFVDLVDTEDPVYDMDQLGPWLIIYRGESVMRRSYIGDLTELFFDEYTLQGLGIIGSGCIAPTGNSHFFFGEQGMFLYQGGYDVEDVGEKIYDSVFGPEGDFNENLARQSFCAYISELDEVWLFYPSTSAVAYCDTLRRYNLGDDSWWKRKFANEIAGFGFIESKSGRTWQEATQPWNTDTLPWNARANTAESPQTILCDATTGNTWLYDYITQTDNGVPIQWSYTTKDFISPPYLLRLDSVRARGTGSNIGVAVSVDAGNSFVPLTPLTFGLNYSTQHTEQQLVGDQVRVQFSGSDPTATIDWFRVDFFEETPW